MPKESAILDIPDIAIFQFSSIDDLIGEFENQFGVKPEAVALPVTCAKGIPFENEFVEAVGVRYKGEATYTYLGELAENFARQGLDIYLVINPALPFVRSDALHVVDIVGDSSGRTCIAKKLTQKILIQFAQTALEKVQEAVRKVQQEAVNGKAPQLKGIAIDVVNLWPMGADEHRIELTCFCKDCREQLIRISPRGEEVISSFEKFPNPWNLLLKDSGTGVEPISSIEWDTPVEKIISLSQLKGFDNVIRREYGDNLDPLAIALLDYMRTRHHLTVNSISSLFQSIIPQDQQQEINRVLIVEANNYDWSEGLFLKKLDDHDVCNEIWVNPAEDFFVPTNVAMRSYMCRRSRYYVDAFFEMWANLQSEEKKIGTDLANFGNAALAKLLERRRQQAVSTLLNSKLDLLCLPELSQDKETGRIGFIGVGLSETVSKQLVEMITSTFLTSEKKPQAGLSVIQKIFESGLLAKSELSEEADDDTQDI